jgi:uncharacterized protein (UPF0276 family)
MRALIPSNCARKVLLGATIDGNDAALIERVVPLVDMVEVTPDRWASFRRNRPPQFESEDLHVLSEISRIRPLLLHGVGLSIASHDHCSPCYMSLLDQLFEHSLHIPWHSEHLAFSQVDGESLGTMLEPPWSHEALDLIVARIDDLQERYGVPFLIEHVARGFPESVTEDMDSAEFLNALLRRTGCGLLLDVYNLECDHYNFGADPLRLLNALNLDAVREIHVAGGTIYDGFKVDIHSRVVEASTLTLLDHVLDHAHNAEVVVFEVLKEAVPVLGVDTIADELCRLRRFLDARQ